jgi:hypothetical protein
LSLLRVAGILACVVGVVAAVRPDAEPIAGNFTTNDTGYVAMREPGGGPVVRYGFTLVARYRNPTSAPIYLARCHASSPTPVYDVQLVEASHSGGSAYSPVWACAAHDKQIVVAPGAARVDTLKIDGPATWSGVTKKPLGVLEGRFRLAYDPQGCPGDGRCEIVVDSLRYSNEFTIHLAK